MESPVQAPLVWTVEVGLELGLSEPGRCFIQPPPTQDSHHVIRGLCSPEYFAWAVGSVLFSAGFPMETRLCHLKVLKIKLKPASHHPLQAAQDLGVDLGMEALSSPGPGKACLGSELCP